jgi:hypothetical protein
MLALAVPAVAACTSRTPNGIGVQRGSSGPSSGVPRPQHIVVVILENHAYSEIIGSAQAHFINRLAAGGALFTQSYGVTHPSEPNYLALFSGSTHSVTTDQCPTVISAPNLAAELAAAHLTFTGYAEGLPAPGSSVCDQGNYARKHVPWADFSNVARSVSQPFSQFPAGNYQALPVVSFVVPNLCNDMHDCSVATGDQWLRVHLAGYARWAVTHDSLLIVTFDEDDGSQSNHIATIIVGEHVVPGKYAKPVDHYNILRTIEQAFSLHYTGQAATHYPITWIWRTPG